MAARCRTEKLLCGAFALYVHGRGRPSWAVAPRAPTRALYDATLEREQRPLGRPEKRGYSGGNARNEGHRV